MNAEKEQQHINCIEFGKMVTAHRDYLQGL